MPNKLRRKKSIKLLGFVSNETRTRREKIESFEKNGFFFVPHGVFWFPKLSEKHVIFYRLFCELFGSAMDRDTQTVRERNRNKRISDLFIYYVNFNVNHTFTWRRKGPEGSCNRL